MQHKENWVILRKYFKYVKMFSPNVTTAVDDK